MRLFIATDLDDTARREIAAYQWQLGRAGRRGSQRWTKPEQMHVTLAFIGEADEVLTAKLTVAMMKPLSQASFDVAFERVGVFPPHGAPRVLWLGVGAGADGMIALQREVAARLEPLGVALERRTFHPHLTLARWRESRAGDRRAIDNLPDPGVVARVRIDHATLYRSQTLPSGSVYTPLARARLS
jgi:RNA 2',3'-cyclic 3'-phosphodiesterase